MDSIEAQILSTFNTFWETWARRKNKSKTIDDITPFFDKSISSFGTGEHELGKDLDMVIQNFSDDFNELETPISINYSYQKASLLSPTTGYVEAEANLNIELENEAPLDIHLRFSTLFILKDSKWLIRHNHVSFPSSEQDIGESYPIDALRAKNNQLEKLVAQRTEELEVQKGKLQEERDKTESLLFNILPQRVAKELMSTGSHIPVRHNNVSVMFTDFKQFTKIAASITPKQLVKELNEIFFQFDELTKKGGLEKIKTIGDSYMAVCGLPEADELHAYKCVDTAKKMLEFIDQRNETNEIKWHMRIGIHSGPVVAGIVGNHKFAYDIWGNTVNIASRLESAGTEGRINISEETYLLIKDKISCDYQGLNKIKGNQSIKMFLIS